MQYSHSINDTIRIINDNLIMWAWHPNTPRSRKLKVAVCNRPPNRRTVLKDGDNEEVMSMK